MADVAVAKIGNDLVEFECVNCVSIDFDCSFPGEKISPYIYGIAFHARKNHLDKNWLFELNPTTRRWGGNPTSRYNWRINSWNTAQDWYFRNIETGKGFVFERDFIVENTKKKILSNVTLPLLGWVAKDNHSGSFPVNMFPDQLSVDLSSGFGNGENRYGKIHVAPEVTSKIISNEDIDEWVSRIVMSAEGQVNFSLGNEPMLWNHTHHDVHPKPVGYKEVIDKSIELAGVVKKYPNTFVSGPGSWGWPSYFYSSLDMKTGVQYGDDQSRYKTPFLEWYLEKFRELESKTGSRHLDALDIHYYPQAEGVFQGTDNPDMRVRSTRSLWDKEYVDESWVDEPIYLIPRMKRIIEKNYPKTKLIIGEYSFGETNDVSGAIAVAESLGVFAQHGVYAAYYWVYPKRYSSSYWGFRMFRNFDGKGSSFAGNMLTTYREKMYSHYVGIDESKKRVTIIAINGNKEKKRLRVNSKNCAEILSSRHFEFDGNGKIEERRPRQTMPLKGRSLALIEVKFR